MMSCDTCKKVIRELEPVTATLASNNVKVICGECRKKYDKILMRYRTFAWKRLRRKMKKDSKKQALATTDKPTSQNSL